MSRLFWISIVLVLITVLLAHAHAMAGEPSRAEEAATARSFCARLIAGEDAEAAARMDDPLRQALGPNGAQEIRDTWSSTLGAVVEIGDAWFVDEIQGYRRYRVPVRFEQATRDLLIAFEPGGKVGGLFTREHLDPPSDRRTGEVSDARAAGEWGGTLAIPGSPLHIHVSLFAGDDGWSGTVDIPAQALIGHPLEAIEVEGDEVTFRLVGIPGEPTFRGNLVGDELRGFMTQAATTIRFNLRRGETAELSRPQTPQPPFDYNVEEVAYQNGGIRLAGTLTIPKGRGPFPAVLLISGSGAQDRDEMIFGHRPFLVWADHLTKAGIAVLRVDDRGIGGSSGSVAESTSSDFAEDALAGVRYLGTRPEVDSTNIGLMGHSEGGIVAPLAAARSDQVAFVVLLAGVGVPGSELMALQMELVLKAAGVSEERVARSVQEAHELYRVVLDGGTHAAVAKQLGRLKKAQGDPSAVTPEEVSQMTSTWMRFFLGYDPRTALKEVDVPVLALNGSLDLQVDAGRNLDAIREALQHNDAATVRRLPGLNHLFQTAGTGAIGEYGRIEETIAPDVLDEVRDWILARVSAQEGAIH